MAKYGCAQNAIGLLGISLILCVQGLVRADVPSIVVPIDLRSNGAPMITAHIDGQKVPLIFDSGSSATVSLAREVIDRIKAVPLNETSRGFDPKGNTIEYPKYRIRSLRIGAAVFNDVVAELDVHDPSYQADQVGQQGFLGTSLLKGYAVVLDYPRRRLILVPPGATSASCRGAEVPFSPAWHGEPATEGDAEFGHLTVWWDTGAPVTILSKRFVQAAALRASGNAIVSKHWIVGGSDFGPLTFEVPDLAFPFDGAIGYPFFSRHVVCLDFPNKKLVLPP
jgi:hypothetical protein